MKVWQNGVVSQATDATVSFLDRGFQFGHGCFETILAKGGKYHQLEIHLQRLKNSCELLGISIQESIIHEGLAALESAGWAKIRIMVTAGSGSDFAPKSTTGKILIARTSIEAPSPTPVLVSAVVSDVFRDSRDQSTAGKFLGYSSNAVAAIFGRTRGVGEGLLQSSQGGLAEAPTGNLVGRKGATWYAPGRQSGALDGTTRGMLAKHLNAVDLPVPRDCEELWIVSSIAGPRMVHTLDGRILQSTNDLRAIWIEELRHWEQGL